MIYGIERRDFIRSTGLLAGAAAATTLPEERALAQTSAAATRSLGIEYAARNIRVNAVAPGMIKTSMHAPARLTAMAALHPLNRMDEIADIVEAILYLENANFVTGEILHVDGGQIAGH